MKSGGSRVSRHFLLLDKTINPTSFDNLYTASSTKRAARKAWLANRKPSFVVVEDIHDGSIHMYPSSSLKKK